MKELVISAVKLLLWVLLILVMPLLVCIVFDLVIPNILAFVYIALLSIVYVVVALAGLPLTGNEFLPLPNSLVGWIVGCSVVVFMLFLICFAIVYLRYLMRKKYE